ncbi:MAG: hypothetical protein IPL40_09730 [Proteobacteria bacterium]|nr:hypothetical protein [Pseudomonadota bacterium]
MRKEVAAEGPRARAREATRPAFPTAAREPASTRPRHFHHAYGLRICSELALPELPRARANEGIADLTIAFGCVPARPPPLAHAHAAPGLKRLVLGPQDVRYLGDPVGRFAVRDGVQITIDRAPGATEDALRPYLLSRLLGIALLQRGHLVLHGSVVAHQGRALGLLGPSGAGKSTLAAALAARDWAVLADEHVVLDRTSAGAPQVLRAGGALKLDSAAARAAGLLDPASPAQQGEERYYRLATQRPPALAEAAPRLPIVGLCVLQRGAALGSGRLSPRAALLACVAHAYGAPLLAALGLQADHFTRCATLVAQLPVYELTRGDDLEHLPALADRVVDLLTGGTSP